MRSLGQLAKSAWRSTSRSAKALGLSALLSASLMSAAPNARAGDDEWPRPFVIEFEPVRVGASQDTEAKVYPNKEFRTVPNHPDDPHLTIDPLRRGPYTMYIDTGVVDAMNLKFWLYETIGFGVGVRAECPNSSDSKDNSDIFMADWRRCDFYDYAPDYGVPGWGSAYIYCKTSAESDENQFRYFIEAKTPRLPLFKLDDTPVNLSLFAGYEPEAGNIDLEAENGWHRWGAPEPRKKYDLGTIEYSREYAGLRLSLETKEVFFGTSAAIEKEIMHVDLTEKGKQFGTTVESPHAVPVFSIFFGLKF